MKRAWGGPWGWASVAHVYDHRGEAAVNRGHSGAGFPDLMMTLGYFDDLDERWAEERTYDEAYGPPDPHHGPVRIDEWSSPLDAVELRVAAVQQAAYNVAHFSPLGRVLHNTPGKFGYTQLGCRCDECCEAKGLKIEPREWGATGPGPAQEPVAAFQGGTETPEELHQRVRSALGLDEPMVVVEVTYFIVPDEPPDLCLLDFVEGRANA